MNVIYIHKGYSWYVPLALLNGKKFCSGQVHFIGDAFGCRVARWCGATAWPIHRFRKAADEFAKIYGHHSQLGLEFELFCIQRWFILAEFMAEQGLDACTYLDTDVLLTRNIDGERTRTAGFGLTYTGYSAHVCFVNHLAALKKLCSYITALYADPTFKGQLKQWHRDMMDRAGSGGVSDMTLFHWFQKENPEILGDYPSIFGDSPFDVSLEEIRGFQSDAFGFKRLVWENNRPYATTTDGLRIELVSLHHQGRGKCRLKEHAGKLGVGLATRSILAPLAGNIHRAGRKIVRFSACLVEFPKRVQKYMRRRGKSALSTTQ